MAVAKSKILIIEPDTKSLKQLEHELSNHYRVISTYVSDRATAILRADSEIKAIVLSTSKGADVLGLLNAVRHEFPNVLRVLLTAFEDLTQIVEGLHSGAIHRVVSKPLVSAELLSAVPTHDSYGSSAAFHPGSAS